MYSQRKQTARLPSPNHLALLLPIRGTTAEQLVLSTRHAVGQALAGRDDRLLVVLGPCSIHEPASALEYARLLRAARERYRRTLEIVMRVYLEKPRTMVGWKGLINDPRLDGSCRIDEGLRAARQLLLEINHMGLLAGTEFLDVISPRYVGNLISWGAIGARTTESQVHRELASGLQAPIGFKNGTEGNVRIAIDGIRAAARSHRFLSVDHRGQVAIMKTARNKYGHLILRGGNAPNYDEASIEAACRDLSSARLHPRVTVDWSHGNSGKQPDKHVEVAHAICGRIADGSRAVFGVMVESHLKPGAQNFTPGRGRPSHAGVRPQHHRRVPRVVGFREAAGRFGPSHTPYGAPRPRKPSKCVRAVGASVPLSECVQKNGASRRERDL